MGIDDIRNIEPARQFLWSLLIVAPVHMPTVPFRIKTASVPDKVVETIEINYKGDKALFAGRDASAKTLTCAFWDDEALSISTGLRAWLNLIRNSTTGVGLKKSDYAGSAILTLQNNNDEPLAVYTMNGFYIENIGEVALDYSSSEAIEISATFRYDKFTQTL